MSDREVTPASISAAIGAWIGLLVSANAMISATTSNFMKPLSVAFGVNRTTISAALSIAPLLVAFMVPIAGRAMDRFGLRRVLLPGVVLFVLTFMALSQTTSILQFALVQVLASIASSMHTPVGYAKLVSLWFDRWRGLVLGLIVALGAGVGQTAMPPVSRWLIENYGWQRAYQGIGLIVLVREPPAKRTLDKSAEPAEVVGLTWREGLRRPAFWLIFVGIFLGSMTLIGTLVHGVPMLTEHGFTTKAATTALSFSFAGVVIGQLTSGALANQINSPRVVLPYFASGLIGLLIVHSLRADASTTTLYLGALMMGLGLGGEVAQNAYLCSRYFGLKAFGTLYGLTFAASNLGIAVGTITGGKIHDLFGSYDPLRYVFGTGMAVSLLCMSLLGPYVYARRS
jgi:MFS family permease